MKQRTAKVNQEIELQRELMRDKAQGTVLADQETGTSSQATALPLPSATKGVTRDVQLHQETGKYEGVIKEPGLGMPTESKSREEGRGEQGEESGNSEEARASRVDGFQGS